MKKIAFALMLIITIATLNSCITQGKENNISVRSSDYYGLKTIEFSECKIENPSLYSSLDYKYDKYACYVSVVENELCINNGDEQISFIQPFDNGYFLGVDLGEFDGWVKCYPYYSTYPEAGESKLVTDESCKGIIQINRTKGYILTAKQGESITGTIYSIVYSSTSMSWEWSVLQNLDSAPVSYYKADNGLWYVITEQSILIIDAEGKIQTLAKPEIFNHINVNSIVCIDNTIYCGSALGVYRYNMVSKTEDWHMFDYSKYVE